MNIIQPADRPLIDASLALLDKQVKTAQKSLIILGLPTLTVDRLEEAAAAVRSVSLDVETDLEVSAAGALRLALWLLMEQLTKLAERAQKLNVGLEDVETTLKAAQDLSDRLTQYRKDWTS
jgi:hypothetical protein